MNNEIFPSRAFLRILAAVILGGIVLLGIYWLIQPRFVIDAPTGSRIVITNMSGNALAVNERATGGSTTVAVAVGYYKIVVDSGSVGQLFYENASVFERKTLTLDAPRKLTAALAAKVVAFNAFESGENLTYLNTTSREIDSSDINGNQSKLDTFTSASQPGGGAEALKPIANNQAIVMTANTLYLLKNNQLTALNTDGLPNGVGNIVEFATSPTQSSFVVAVNQSLFLYRSPTAVPEKILDVSKRFDAIAYGGDKVIVFSTRMPNADEDIRYAYSSYAVDPIIVDITNKTQTVLTSGPLTDASISPDGNLGITEVRNASTSTIFNLANDTRLYSVENPDTTTPTWTDATHYMYGKGPSVWLFDTTSRTATALGTLPVQPTSIVYDAADSRYFVTSYDSADQAAIYKLSHESLNGSDENAVALANGIQSSDLFQFKFTDINMPRLTIETQVVSNSPTEAQFQIATLESRQAALDYLKANGVDPNQLIIVYDPANP